MIARVKDQVGGFDSLARAQPVTETHTRLTASPSGTGDPTHVIAPPELHPLLLHVA